MGSDRTRAIRRCPSCGSRLAADARRCAICGAPVPWRMTMRGAAIESLLALGLVALVVMALLWWRGGRDAGPAVSSVVAGDALPSEPAAEPTGAPPAADVGTISPDAPATPTTDPAQAGLGTGLPAVPGPAPVQATDDAAAVAPSSATEPGLAPPAAEATDPGGTGVPPVTGEPVVVRPAQRYTVQQGDTLGGIAARHGLSLEELIRFNADRLAGPDSLILVGDQLVISPAELAPATSAPATAAAPPTPISVDQAAWVAEETSSLTRYPAPLIAAPRDGAVEIREDVLLQWASVGILPPGVYYVVLLRDADNPRAKPHPAWVTSNATALRVPGNLRPALGTTRAIEWSVSIRRRAGRLVGGDDGVLLSDTPRWQHFTWSPGERADAATP